MTAKVAVVCDKCGRQSVVPHHADNTGMVQLLGQSTMECLILMVDIPKGKSSRPTFRLDGKHWCPPCLIVALREWLGVRAAPKKGTSDGA